jgi:hypothetical protein
MAPKSIIKVPKVVKKIATKPTKLNIIKIAKAKPSISSTIYQKLEK